MMQTVLEAEKGAGRRCEDEQLAGIEFRDLTHRASRGPLTEGEARAAMRLMADGVPSELEIREFLLTPALSPEDVNAATLTGLVTVVRERALSIPGIDRYPLFDTCGTGGGATTFNISTAAALCLAAAGEHVEPAARGARGYGGLGVAKHGNRAVASRSGSADVLESLGVAVEVDPVSAARSINETGFGFLFAQKYHRAFSFIQPVRRALAAEGRRTAFNFVGPLANPAPVTHQILGIFMPSKLRTIAEVLRALGTQAALCVCGETESGAPLDELSLSGPSHAVFLRNGELSEITIEPGDFGMASVAMDRPMAGADGLAAASAAESARIIRDVFDGRLSGKPAENIVVINAAAGLHLAGYGPLRDCAALVHESISSGAPKRLLQRLAAQEPSHGA